MKTLISKNRRTKRVLMAGLFFLFVSTIAASIAGQPLQAEADKGPFDIRQVKWGMSRDEVKSTEKLKIMHSDENRLVYQTSLYKYDVVLIYLFTFDQLIEAVYVINENHKDRGEYILDYNHLKTFLEKKYGKPKSEESIWDNNLYKEDPHYWGTAIAVGHLKLITTWETERTNIVQYLVGHNFEISHRIEYKSKCLEGLGERTIEKKILEDL